ncbi:ABC transporter ATP-binding protein [Christensenellaceae bacterium OttesenSCG-928-M15]|nr:ABC transporter ATP-binding protein [Christensenellaceae bacterium OttesenSCG-928-M15]
MIEVRNVTKKFGQFTALKDLSCSIDSGRIYGLVGSNGAGKSTLMRLMTGVYRPDGGEITVDGSAVYNHPAVKKRMVYVSDDIYFLPQANMKRMAMFYAAGHEGFSHERFKELSGLFGLNTIAPLSTFSKGMRRQAAVILSLCCGADFLFMDETFDGLDPVMRELVKKMIYMEMENRGATAVIASHSLRELEDTCDQLALLHKGGIVFESDIQNLKTSLFKVQVAFSAPFGKEVFEGIETVNFSKQGSVAMAIVRGDRAEVQKKLLGQNPLLVEILPLSLEEVFIHEMEALGYAFDETRIGELGGAKE